MIKCIQNISQYRLSSCLTHHNFDVNVRVTSYECHGIVNHWQFDCLFNSLLTKVLITGLCELNPLVTGCLPSRRAINEEIIYIWHHHVLKLVCKIVLTFPLYIISVRNRIHNAYSGYCYSSALKAFNFVDANQLHSNFLMGKWQFNSISILFTGEFHFFSSKLTKSYCLLTYQWLSAKILYLQMYQRQYSLHKVLDLVVFLPKRCCSIALQPTTWGMSLLL